MIKIYFFGLFFFVSALSYSQTCDTEIETHCENGTIPLRECLKTKMMDFSEACRLKLMEPTQKDVGANDSCVQDFQNNCGPDESVEDCLKNRGGQLLPFCREQFTGDGTPTLFSNPLVKKILDNCMEDIKKLCPFNAKVIGQNPTKAIGDYQNCVVKSLSKVGKKCKDIFKPSKKKKDVQVIE